MLTHISENVKRLRQMTATQAAILLSGLNPIKTISLYDVNPDKRDDVDEILTVILQAISLKEFKVNEAWGEQLDDLSVTTEIISVEAIPHSVVSLITEASFDPKDFWPWAIENCYISPTAFSEKHLINTSLNLLNNPTKSLNSPSAATAPSDLIKKLAIAEAAIEKLSHERDMLHKQQALLRVELENSKEELAIAFKKLEKSKLSMEEFKRESIHGKRKQSVLSMIGALAMVGYSIPIHEKKKKNSNDLIQDLQRCGVPLDPGTIQSILEDAAEVLPRAGNATAEKL